MQFITASVQTLQWFVAYYISMGLQITVVSRPLNRFDPYSREQGTERTLVQGVNPEPGVPLDIGIHEEDVCSCCIGDPR